MTPDNLKSIRTTLFKRMDINHYTPIILECADPRTLDALFITTVRLCTRDKSVLFIPASDQIVMTYGHVKPGIFKAIEHIRKFRGAETGLCLEAPFSYEDFFLVKFPLVLSNLHVEYVRGDYDEMVKREKAAGKGLVLCPISRIGSSTTCNIKLSKSKQMLLDALTDHGVPQPIGKILSRSGIFKKNPDYTGCTPDQIRICETAKAYFKANPGKQLRTINDVKSVFGDI